MPKPSCLDTSLAVIYTDSASIDGSETLAQDIRAFQRAFWNYTGESYTGVFNIDDHRRVGEPFKEAGKFHESTYTASWVKERGTFSPGLLELLRYKGVTHVIVLGLDVVAIAKGAPIPSAVTLHYGGRSVTLPAIDGDATDHRWADPNGVAVILRGKRSRGADPNVAGFILPFAESIALPDGVITLAI